MDAFTSCLEEIKFAAVAKSVPGKVNLPCGNTVMGVSSTQDVEKNNSHRKKSYLSNQSLFLGTAEKNRDYAPPTVLVEGELIINAGSVQDENRAYAEGLASVQLKEYKETTHYGGHSTGMSAGLTT